MESKQDLIGQKYAELVIEEVLKNTSRNLVCRCSCGNKTMAYLTELVTGRKKSCGCKREQYISSSRTKDLSGNRYGRLLVIRRIEGEFRTKGGHCQVKYLCLCDCGNYTEVYAGNLRKGNTKSCGCLGIENREKNVAARQHDLTGQRFYKLTVLRKENNYVGPHGTIASRWLCLCDCGETVIVNESSLLRGLTKSCGCIKRSYGETTINEYLIAHNIKYKREYRFKDLLTSKGNPMRFDFAVFDSKNDLLFLIEFQGVQHYKKLIAFNKDFGKLQREETDPAKRKYCKDHNITLFEIKYNENINQSLDRIFQTMNNVDMSTPCQASSESV